MLRDAFSPQELESGRVALSLLAGSKLVPGWLLVAVAVPRAGSMVELVSRLVSLSTVSGEGSAVGADGWLTGR